MSQWHNLGMKVGDRNSHENLQAEVERLRTELTRRERDTKKQQRENGRQQRQIDGLQGQIERQKREIEQLRGQLAAARRAGFRQAAPFAKDRPQGRGRRPGRRAGTQYGRKACRPRPARVDQTLEAPVPTACPDCGGSVEVTHVASQYQEEIPEVRPIVRRFDIEVGRCSQCRRRVQGRHVLQTSDALGAAGAQLGPGVVALVVELHTEMGVPLAKVAHVLRTTFGLQVTPGGLAHLLHRTARDAAPTYTALCEQVRNSPVVTPDETGWRVGGLRHWLWAWVTPETTVYAICPGRGFDDAATVLGADFAGVLVRDGWVSYRCYRATPSTPLGFTARVAPSWGGEAASGAEAMWGRETMAGMANGGLASGNRLDGEVGYGLPVGSRSHGEPQHDQQPDGELARAIEHRPAGHRQLRPAAAGSHDRELDQRPPERERHQRHDLWPDRRPYRLPGAGEGHQRRGRRRLVAAGAHQDDPAAAAGGTPSVPRNLLAEPGDRQVTLSWGAGGSRRDAGFCHGLPDHAHLLAGVTI